jgi:hypothetical protein
MRIGNHPGMRYGCIRDYHFWVQTNVGEWADKPNWYDESRLKGFVNPSNEMWKEELMFFHDNMGTDGWFEFYDSKTIYFATTR